MGSERALASASCRAQFPLERRRRLTTLGAHFSMKTTGAVIFDMDGVAAGLAAK
jgi:hypothetical protein